MVQGPAPPAAYLPGMDVVVRVLIVVLFIGIGVMVGVGTGTGSSGGLGAAIFWAGFVLVPLAGVLTFVWLFVGPHCTVRHAGLRRTVRAILVAAYAGIAVWGWYAERSRYAREVAGYDPTDECRNLAGDCVPRDGRVGWLIIWALVGLVGVDASRRSARRLRESPGADEPAAQRVGQLSLASPQSMPTGRTGP